MMRLNLVVFVAVMASAMYLVHNQHQSRRLVAAIEKEQSTARRLALDTDRLAVERRSQATSLRVERIAKERLKMRPAPPQLTHYVAKPQKTQAAKESGNE